MAHSNGDLPFRILDLRNELARTNEEPAELIQLALAVMGADNGVSAVKAVKIKQLNGFGVVAGLPRHHARDNAE